MMALAGHQTGLYRRPVRNRPRPQHAELEPRRVVDAIVVRPAIQNAVTR